MIVFFQHQHKVRRVYRVLGYAQHTHIHMTWSFRGADGRETNSTLVVSPSEIHQLLLHITQSSCQKIWNVLHFYDARKNGHQTSMDIFIFPELNQSQMNSLHSLSTDLTRVNLLVLLSPGTVPHTHTQAHISKHIFHCSSPEPDGNPGRASHPSWCVCVGTNQAGLSPD